MGLKQSVKPITYLKTHTADIVRDVAETGREVIITQNGEARAVLMGVATWDRWQDTLAMLKIIAQGEQAIASGDLHTPETAFARARAAIKRAVDERTKT